MQLQYHVRFELDEQKNKKWTKIRGFKKTELSSVYFFYYAELHTFSTKKQLYNLKQMSCVCIYIHTYTIHETPEGLSRIYGWTLELVIPATADYVLSCNVRAHKSEKIAKKKKNVQRKRCNLPAALLIYHYGIIKLHDRTLVDMNQKFMYQNKHNQYESVVFISSTKTSIYTRVPNACAHEPNLKEDTCTTSIGRPMATQPEFPRHRHGVWAAGPQHQRQRAFGTGAREAAQATKASRTCQRRATRGPRASAPLRKRGTSARATGSCMLCNTL